MRAGYNVVLLVLLLHDASATEKIPNKIENVSTTAKKLQEPQTTSALTNATEKPIDAIIQVKSMTNEETPAVLPQKETSASEDAKLASKTNINEANCPEQCSAKEHCVICRGRLRCMPKMFNCL